MDIDLYQLWYVIVGFLLGNGFPHFVFGRAGKIFRSPFGQRSSPKTNVAWGTANFAAATFILVVMYFIGDFSGLSPLFLLVGFWLTVLMFGTGIARFLNE
jgi:hypothetical protein